MNSNMQDMNDIFAKKGDKKSQFKDNKDNNVANKTNNNSEYPRI